MSSVTEMRRSVRFPTGNSQSCPSAGRLSEGNTPFPDPFGQLLGTSTSTSTSTRTLVTIPESNEGQHTSSPSNGFPLKRQNCSREEINDGTNRDTICLRCPIEGLCIACGSNTTEPPAILRSQSVCGCDDPNHEKGHH